MAKLKKAKVTVHICPTCKGNGYLKVATEGKDQVHQCWDCESSGELEITEPSLEDLETSSRLQWLKIL